MPVLQAWLVAVDLKAVARRMYAHTGKTASELDAMLHLSCSHKGERSPLRATLELGLYYSEIDPSLLMEPDEVIYIRKVSRMADPTVITGTTDA